MNHPSNIAKAILEVNYRSSKWAKLSLLITSHIIFVPVFTLVIMAPFLYCFSYIVIALRVVCLALKDDRKKVKEHLLLFRERGRKRESKIEKKQTRH